MRTTLKLVWKPILAFLLPLSSWSRWHYLSSLVVHTFKLGLLFPCVGFHFFLKLERYFCLKLDNLWSPYRLLHLDLTYRLSEVQSICAAWLVMRPTWIHLSCDRFALEVITQLLQCFLGVWRGHPCQRPIILSSVVEYAARRWFGSSEVLSVPLPLWSSQQYEPWLEHQDIRHLLDCSMFTDCDGTHIVTNSDWSHRNPTSHIRSSTWMTRC